MDRFLIGKSCKHDDTSKPPHKKASKRKHSGEDKRAKPTFLSFPPQNLSKETTFKTLYNVVPSSPRSRHFPRPRPHKSKDAEIKKILGVICGDDSSRKRKIHVGKKSRENLPSSGSCSSSPSQVHEHRSHHKPKKRRPEKEDFQQRSDWDAENQRRSDEFYRQSERDDFQGSDKDQRQSTMNNLCFTSSESDNKESPSLLKSDQSAPGFGNPVLDNSINRKPELEKSPEIATIAEKEEAINSPVLSKGSKSRYSDHELLAEYMNFSAEITDELTGERQKLCSGKSYLEEAQESLFSVLVGRCRNDEKQADERKGSEEDTFTGKSLLDFITCGIAEEEKGDSTKNPFQIDPRKNQERRIGSPKIQNFPDVHDAQRDRQSPVSKETGLPENFFSQHKPKSPAPENFQLGKFAGPQFFDFRVPVCEEKEPEPDSQIWLSPEIDETDQFEDLDAVSYLKKIRGPTPNLVAEHTTDSHKTAATRCLSPNFPKRFRPTTKASRRLYLSSPSPPHSLQNDFFPFSERTKYLESWEETPPFNHQKEVIRMPSQVSCTATSTKPMDYEFLDKPFAPSELPFISPSIDLPTIDFRDSYHNCERSDREFRSRQLYSKADVPLDTHSSGQRPFKDPATETSQKKSFLDILDTKKDDYFVSPKFYKRRMF